MLLTREEQIDTLHAAAVSWGIPVDKTEIDWRDETVQLGELKIHYLDWGAEEKPPMLLLHGGMQSSHSWDLIAVLLKRDYHVVAMDLRGHGDSDWADDYSHAATMGDVARLVDHLGWQRLSLMGLSMGGLAAMNYAAEHSDRIERLVIVDVGPELNAGGVGRIVQFGRGPSELDSVEEFVQRAVEYNPHRKAEQLRYSLTHNLRRLPNGKWTWKHDQRLSRRPPETAQREAKAGGEPSGRYHNFTDLWERLRRIECPTLVVRGGDSDVFAEATGLRMVELLTQGRFVTVPDAGHTVPQDNPTGFLAAVRPFLENAPS
jgi:pimeloyl-ACP methyl ester carboxylesterase